MEIRNAFISVSDKSGILKLCEGLVTKKINLYSTGGTYAFLSGHGIKVNPLEKIAPFPEILDGKVKSLQPEIHGGILLDRTNQNHLETTHKHKITPIDLVVVNLYPFEEKVETKKSHEEIIENIDIGGVALIRAAAKNHEWVTVLHQEEQYEACLKEILSTGNTSLSFRKKLALKAFAYTFNYDQKIFQYLNQKFTGNQSLSLSYTHSKRLKYGENPHQKAEFLFNASAFDEAGKLHLAGLTIMHGAEMSYNNHLDVEAGLKILEDYGEEKLVVIVKHQNPCGIGLSNDLRESLELAWQGDIVSAFGSIVVFNGEVDLKVVEFLKKKFVEIIVAKAFTSKALNELKKKKRKIIQFHPDKKVADDEYKIVTGGILRQEKSKLLYRELIIPSKKKTKPLTAHEKRFFDFSIKAVKRIKSNAIAIASEFKKNQFMLIGMGSGQPNRLDAMKLALEKAKHNLKRLLPESYQKKLSEALLVSDAFFPFKDGIELANEFGIKNIVEPGGSIRDAEVIAACEKHKINLYFSGVRHFYH